MSDSSFATVSSEEQRDIKIGLALSGGGSRAIAFHFGAMKALRDLGLLERINVISSVSGGSVVNAIWASSNMDWEIFDCQVKRVLNKGFQRSIFLKLLTPWRLVSWAGFALAWFSASLFLVGFRFVLNGLAKITSFKAIAMAVLGRLPIQIPRAISRSTAFELVLNDFFKDAMLSDFQNLAYEMILNSTDLRTGTAFRFGNLRCGCRNTSRNGRDRFEISSQQFSLAKAVLASAAYPILLPAVECRFTSIKGDHLAASLVDGGVYDNLGISCLSPERDPEFSIHVSKLDYIFCSSAAQGRPEREYFSSPFPQRMISVSLVQFRKLQEAGFQDLFDWKRSGKVRGIALAYLGQNVTDTPSEDRDRALSYPTNFASMTQIDQELLTNLGYQRMLESVKAHCPELFP